MISDILKGIYQASKLIYEQVELVKANQAQSHRLSERVRVVVQAVKRLETVENSEQYRPALLALQKCLEESLAFVKVFVDDKSWFKKVLKAGTHQKRFDKLSEQLLGAIAPLNLK